MKWRNGVPALKKKEHQGLTRGRFNGRAGECRGNGAEKEDGRMTKKGWTCV